MEQPKDRYKILIESKRGLFGEIKGANMSVALHAGHDSVEYDNNDKHRTLVLYLYGEKPDEIWVIENLKVVERSYLVAELTLKKTFAEDCKHYDREEINLVMDGKTPPITRCRTCGKILADSTRKTP